MAKKNAHPARPTLSRTTFSKTDAGRPTASPRTSGKKPAFKGAFDGDLLGAAAQGDAEAQFDLACCLADGSLMPQDLPRAAEWFRKAAEQGHADAQEALGHALASGSGCDADPQEAVFWFRKAANRGSEGAFEALGEALLTGTGVKSNPAEAVIWLRKAAEAGRDHAAFLLARCLANGWGVERNDAEACSWLEKAGEALHEEALRTLGDIWLEGVPGVPSTQNAGRIVRQAAADGSAVACDVIAHVLILRGGSDARDGIFWLRKAAEQGLASAQCELGAQYAVGSYLERSDKAADHWFGKAAEQGDGRAMVLLGERLCAKDDGDSLGRAVALLEKARAMGFFHASCVLGRCHALGKGVGKDMGKAVSSFKEAAEAGDPTAMTELGKCCLLGEGMPASREQAVEWFTKASEKGDAESCLCLASCAQAASAPEEEVERWIRLSAERGWAPAQVALALAIARHPLTTPEEEQAADREVLSLLSKAADQGNAKAVELLSGMGYAPVRA